VSGMLTIKGAGVIIATNQEVGLEETK
jgi:hypothetical protein